MMVVSLVELFVRSTGLVSSDKGRAMKFRNATRFIVDECNLNDGGEFS